MAAHPAPGTPFVIGGHHVPARFFDGHLDVWVTGLDGCSHPALVFWRAVLGDPNQGITGVVFVLDGIFPALRNGEVTIWQPFALLGSQHSHEAECSLWSMTTNRYLLGADSAFPQPTEYKAGRQWWGVYAAGNTPHVWTPGEVRALDAAGIKGCLPIVVPPQSWPWVGIADGEDGEETVLRELIAEAQAWGVKQGEPLCLDVEESFAELVGTNMASLLSTWYMLVGEGAHFIPWVYGSSATVGEARNCNKWVAYWPEKVPKDPTVPAGFKAWQYAGRCFDDKIDLDVVEGPVVFASTAGTGPITLGLEDPPAPAKPTKLQLQQDLTNAIHAIEVAEATLEQMN